ncbi:MAG: hypothetical protein LDL13_04235 [Calditerrivibrio sp.]|nr:hypothetical protein [Calditerrivibrio sp.]
MDRNILIVSPFFPPIESVATNRILSFAKYLDKYKTTVISLENRSSEAKEEKFKVADDREVNVVRIPDNSFFKKATFKKKTNLLFHNLKALYNRILLATMLDEYDGWMKGVLSYLEKNRISFDVIITSFAPISSHLIGMELKKRYPEKLWIADMRDQMSSNIFFPLHYRKKIKPYEKEIVRYADCITAVSKPIIDDFKKIAEQTDKKIDFIEVRNGFDFEVEPDRYNPNKIFTVTYTGSFYGERNPENFFKATEELIKNSSIVDIKIVFLGVAKPTKIPGILKEKVIFRDRVSNEESIKIMKESDALLLIHPTTDIKGVYTGKLFEYIAVLRPIIALVDPQDVAAELITLSGSGFISDNNDLDGIKQNILKAYKVWSGEINFNPDLEVVNSCKRIYQIDKLQRYIDEKVLLR